MKAFLLIGVLLAGSHAFASDIILCANRTQSLKIQIHNSLLSKSNVVVMAKDAAAGSTNAYTASSKSEAVLITALKSDAGVRFTNVTGKGSIAVKVVSLNEVLVEGQLSGHMACHR